MVFMEDDDLIKELSTKTSKKPLDKRILAAAPVID